MHFLVSTLLIKVHTFIFDRNSLLWPATTGLDWCVVGFLENITISASTKAGVGSNAFLVSAYQSKRLCF